MPAVTKESKPAILPSNDQVVEWVLSRLVELDLKRSGEIAEELSRNHRELT